MSDFDLTEFQQYVDEDEEQEEQAAAPAAAEDDTFRSVHAAGFREFLLKPELLRAIEAAGLEHPSAVQAQSIPQGILGTDVLIQAKAGQGKTLSFVIPILQQLEVVEGQISAVVLVHTRELAYQIFAEFGRFAKFMPQVKAAVFYGGVPVKEHKAQLEAETPNIVIGTPGRMKQLSIAGDFKLDAVKYFVIDECDSVLSQIDMRADIQEIYRRTPHEKQVIMCSATLSDEVKEVIKKFMHNPLEVLVSERSNLTLHGLQQYYVELQESEKNRKLVDLLDSLDFNQVVIFVSSARRADELNKLLIDCNFPSEVIHGRIKQPERIARYKKFKDFSTRILVATNLFGRGVDVAKVNLVIQYDMAQANKRGDESITDEQAVEEGCDSYLHRVGRAGRFGTRGLAISFISSPEDSVVLNGVQKRFSVSIEPLPDKVDPATYMTQ